MDSDAQLLIQSLQNLRLSNKSAPSTKKDPDYCTDLALQENVNDPVVAAVTSDFSIHLMPMSSLVPSSVIRGHKQAVKSIQFCKSSPHLLYSCSEDGTLRCWDTRHSTMKEVQQFKKPQTSRVGLLSLDVSQSGRVLCAGTEKDTEDAYILFWDSRQENVLGCYSECHQDDITQIRFQPGSDQLFAAASCDGLTCTYDISETCEDDAIQFTFNAEADVAKLGWCGENQNSCVYGVTTDNSFYVWDATEGDCNCTMPGVESLKPSGGDHLTEYVLDCIPDMTATEHKSSAVLVTGLHRGDLSLVSYREGDAYVISSLSKGHTTTVRCSLWDSKSCTLLTGGEDGLVCVWKPEAPAVLKATATLDGATPKNVTGKIKENKKLKKADGKPYKKTTKTK